MADTLADAERTQLLLVTLAEELPTAETMEVIDWVDATAVVAPPVVVTNRILEKVSDRVTPEGPVGDMVTLQRALTHEQERWLTRLPPDLTLPYLFGLFTPGEVAAHISDDLEALT
jgi:hypothetical protein